MTSFFVKTKNEIKILFLMILVLILPSMLNFYFGLSMSIGLSVFYAFFLIFIYLNHKKIFIKDQIFISFIKILIILLVFQTFLVYLIFDLDVNYKRIFLSAILLVVTLFMANLFTKLILNLEEKYFSKIVNILFYVLLFIGYLSYILIKLDLKYPGYVKPMLVASEPSHYALIFLPICFAFLYNINDIKLKLIWSVIVFLLAIFLSNITLLVGVLIILVTIFSLKYTLTVFFMISLAFFIDLNGIFSNFVSHINIFTEITRDTNLSLLVYLSGLERGYLDLINSYGVGVGFNNFGYTDFHGKYSDLVIDTMKGYLLCFNDGSFLFAKFLGEFGILAIILTLVYVFFSIKIFITLKNNKISNSKDAFFATIFIIFSVYLFVRGFGYFTSLMFLFTSAIFWYNERFKKGFVC